MSHDHLRGPIGLLHPGQMGSAVGAVLRRQGHDVLWVGDGRGDATRERAEDAGLTDAGSVEELAARSAVVLSICPPHAALDVARQMAAAGLAGTYLDANAVSPDTARTIADAVRAGGATPVDGGIIGGPPKEPGTTRLYLSGPDAGGLAALFAGTPLEARVVNEHIGSASALKMTYAAWTKGTAALLLAIHAVAETEGVADVLEAEWATSQPGLADRLSGARRSAATKGWRWVAEMEEIADTLAADGLPDGFHRAAAEVFLR